MVALALIPRTLSLCESIAAFKPDLVHLFWGHYPSLLGILLGRTPDAPPVTAFLGAYDLRLASPLSGALAPYAKAILTHVHANRPHILRLGVDPEQVHLSYRGIEVPDPLPKPSKNPFALITIGRLIPLKRMDRCLQVLAAVREVHPEVSLTVLGDGPLRTDLEARARELDVDKHVRFKGHVSHDEVFQHLSESAVFLSMSDTDHLPNTIKEAMIRRCVCVSTETHGIEELITDGVSGFIVPQGDVSAAAARITEVFSKRQEAEAIVKAAQEHVCHTFNVDTVTQERLAIWQAIARTAKPKGLGQNGPQSEQRTRLQEGLQ
ncbi:glycosyltransferase [Pelagibius sp.]|uniref:glycosyltransferase n=1 Tax=Pelagibius sp. TaxID=1931238 RepID=UPI003B5043CD